ncbi:serine/threonine-protein kinase [Streptomyces sp. NPDC004980]
MYGVLLAERFRIGERLGSGGMGEVWSAQDERMRREVAVKIVHVLPRMHEEETQARFRREVQLAGRLSHQNIVTVHDWGEVLVGGRPTLYLVMERVPGISVHQRLRESTPPWPLAVGWAEQITQALHTAHRQNVVHRDIKPANVLLTPDGTAKVLDFGVAKFMGDTVSTHDLTVTGAVLGSPPYMSPEQAQGTREIDHRSDLYSLGCLLYHAVTGRPPFTATSPLAVLRMQMDDTATEPGDLVEDLPPELNDLVMSLLAKRPEDRPADAAAVHDALSTLLIDHAARLPDGGLPDIVRLGRADSLAARVLEKTWQAWLRTQQDNASSREEADSYVTETRTRAEEAAAEFETRLAERRDRAERADRELADRQTRTEQRLAELEHRSEQLRVEAEKLRTDAERRARETLEKAREEAGAIVAAAEAEVFRIRGNAGTERPAASVLARGDTSSPFGFELVRRGYDRAQVDDRITELVADRDSALNRISVLEGIAAGLRSGRSDAARGATEIAAAVRAESDTPRARRLREPPAFELVRRGYDRAQVDDRISKLASDRNSALNRISVLKMRIAELYGQSQP